jgi:GntR family transcriptional regulator, transcriptional repressor for pyruvate dehydrogenase complex
VGNFDNERAQRSVEGQGLLYVRIADSLREDILSGKIPPGSRLPSEAELGRLFAASRTSVREALRVLVSQRLITTTRGARGGSFVRQLNHSEITEMLRDNMRSLMVGHGPDVAEMEELRELLEVSATWMAAKCRTDEQLKRMAACVNAAVPDNPTAEQIKSNLGFHHEILRATGNRLMHLFAEPVLASINLVTQEQPKSPAYYRSVTLGHRMIFQAIADRDQAAARDAMSEHVSYLRMSHAKARSRSPFHGLCFGPPAD